MKVTEINKGKIVTPTGFGSYDYGANPYVGCQFGCTYCYVRFFVKDKDEGWGNFVRVRTHITRLFEKHLAPAAGKRLIIGSMTDPYQPIERKQRKTREMLTIIDGMQNPPSEIGIFTRSPAALDDIELFKKLGVRVHITITPYDREVLKRIEPIAILTEARFKLAEKLVQEGVKVHLSISPVMPVLSDHHVQPFAERIAAIQPGGFTVDPMQAYGAAFEATNEALNGMPVWNEAKQIIRDNKRYKVWKEDHYNAWKAAWTPHTDKPIFPISMDHQHKVRRDLRTGEKIDFQNFSYNI